MRALTATPRVQQPDRGQDHRPKQEQGERPRRDDGFSPVNRDRVAPSAPLPRVVHLVRDLISIGSSSSSAAI
jgi:hypothetical protein